MTSPSSEPILPRHPRWEEFLDRLYGPEGCNVGERSWTCFGDTRFTRKILTAMGLSSSAIEVSLAYFRDHSAYCDCEVWLNLDASQQGFG